MKLLHKGSNMHKEVILYDENFAGRGIFAQ